MRRAIIFDIDGTLLRSSIEDDLLYRQAVERVVGTIRFRSSLSEYTHVSDSGILSEILSDNGIDADASTVAAIREQFLVATEKYVSDFGPFQEVPGAKRFLSRLRGSDGYAVAIATGGWRHTARFKLTTAGFDLDGMPLKTADDAVDRMEIMRLALESLGAGLQSITYYGDGPWDEQACQKLGWSFRAVGAALGGIQSYDREIIV